MINYSKLPNDENYNEILEPTAGDGQLIKAISKLTEIDFQVDM